MRGNMRTSLRCAVVVAALVWVASASSAWADPAISFTGVGYSNPASITSTRGWQFDVVNASGVTVTALSFWDEDADGLGQSHDIGIWNSGGSLLTSATVPAGTAAPLDVNGLFRVVDISDISLPLATGYRIGAVYLLESPEHQAQEVTGLAVDPSVSFVQCRWENNGVASLTFPTSTGSWIDPGFFGPSFEVGENVVPEPATLLMLGTGALGLIGYVRRRRMS